MSVLNPQVILAKKNPQEGSGWGVSRIVSKETYVLKKFIKKSWYFPKIGEANETRTNQCFNNEQENRIHIINNLERQISNALTVIQQNR